MTASIVTAMQLSCPGAKIKCVLDIGSLIMMTVEGAKSLLGSYQKSSKTSIKWGKKLTMQAGHSA